MIPTDRPVRSVERKRLTICLRIPPLSTHKGRRGSVGRADAQNERRNAGASKRPWEGWGLGRALPPQPRAARNRVGARHAAPVQRSAAAGHRCNPAPQAKRVSPRRGAASLQSCAAATTRRSRPSRAQRGIVLGRGIVRPYSAQRQRGIAAILRRRRSGSLLVGARHRCNPAPQRPRGAPAPAARSAESCWGAACRARPALSGSGASLQSCAAGEAGLPSSGRGIVRPYSAQRQRGIATILHRRRSGSPLGGARHAAPVQRSAAAGHRCNPAP
jgi:hypothetical protein